MATSGTVGQTVVSVTDLIEHAVRRCGVLPSTMSGEQQLAARMNLYFLLTDLANRGLSLFCVEKLVFGMLTSQKVYDMPVGTIDMLDAMFRTFTTATGSPVSGSGYQGLDLGVGNEQSCENVAVKWSAGGAVTLVLDYSADGATWTNVPATSIVPTAAVAGQWLAFDGDNGPAARFWRLRNTAGALPAISTLNFNYNSYEVNMSPMNRDDYVAFPNKNFTQAGSKTLQYWFDKQVTPRFWTWPAAGDETGQLVIWHQHQIEDVGSFTNSLAVPQRWYESIIFTLAARLALELPAGMLPAGRFEILEAKAAEHLNRAEDGESDGSPIRFVLNLRGYTR